jgi:FKBP-type peptidyl-prolyl cis-trans isomerase
VDAAFALSRPARRCTLGAVRTSIEPSGPLLFILLRRAVVPAAALALAVTSLAACEKKEPPSSTSTSTPPPSASASLDTITMPSAAPAEPPPPEEKSIPAPADVSPPPPDAQKTASGLASKVLTKGTGKVHPTPSDKVKVHYTGWTSDGKMFDSSVTKGEPLSFPLDAVIPGWGEGLQLMVVGEKRRLWIPAKLAYGERPRMGAPGGDLTFDVELLDIAVAPKPPPVPEDVKAAPASAKKTESGIAYRLLSAGPAKNTEHPAATDTVQVHYSGWTTDGKMFDSSVPRGEPATFRLNNVIKGWTEGVQLMRVGDKMRFWIPPALAYGDKPTRPGAPTGTLVFDIELLGISK